MTASSRPEPGRRAPTVLDLPTLIAALPADRRAAFDRIFHVAIAAGDIDPPDSMRPWIEANFGSLDAALHQRVVKVTNLVTLDGALFNPLRAMRPESMNEPLDLAAVLADHHDPFDTPEATTPADTFGRIRGRYCVTAANVAKFDGLHGLVIFDEPHPLRCDRARFHDYLDTSRRWFAAAHQADPAAVYPLLLWNCLWRAGSSIEHGHFQLLLAGPPEAGHYAELERLRRDASVYGATHESDYFDDLYTVHESVDAAFQQSGVRVIANLAPTKEREVLLLADDWTPALNDAVYDVLAHLRDDLGVVSFNLVLTPPPLAGAGPGWAGVPTIARIVDRGDPQSRTCDMGGMELYAARVVSADPLQLAASLRQSMEATR